jgi:predicted TIM-barrel fold metal-dependent hydrolase
MYADHLLQPWLQSLLEDLPGLYLLDGHTHVGAHDPSGFSATFDELFASLDLTGGEAVVFPLAEPSGYRAANLACARAAAESGGRLTAFARVTAADDPEARLDEALDAGARGVKLHPASDEFSLEDDRLGSVFRVADERRLPVVVHSGPELDGVGETVLRLCDRFPRAAFVLAHCALTDLGWIGGRLDAAPRLFIDTSWWGPVHPLALFRLVPPGRIINASDLPYCTPLSGALTTLRTAGQAGLGSDQVRSVMGGQLRRLLEGEEPLDLGAPPQEERSALGPELEIISTTLLTAVEPMQRGEDPGDPYLVTRHACKIPEDHPDAKVVASVVRLLDLYEEHHDRLPRRNQYAPGWDLLSAAAVVARTPTAPVPA